MHRTSGIVPILSIVLWNLLRGPGHAAAALAPADSAYVASVEAWRSERLSRLTSATGWLTVAGLHWLEPGANGVGSDPANRVLLPADASPPRAGVIRLHPTDPGPEFVLEAFPGSGIRCDSVLVSRETFRVDTDGSSPVFTLGRLSFWIIPRAGRYAVRVRDPEYSLRKEFRGIDAYPVDPAYRVVGRLEALAAPRPVPVPNIMGWVDTMFTPGPVVFALGDTVIRLTPLIDAPSDSNLFFVFQDATSGIETYGGGRFLYSDLRSDGEVVLDFNKAYNPPCAFNPNTTCPLPPEGNLLTRPIRAGEKAYAAGH